jgi:hypothetical protein
LGKLILPLSKMKMMEDLLGRKRAILLTAKEKLSPRKNPRNLKNPNSFSSVPPSVAMLSSKRL